MELEVKEKPRFSWKRLLIATVIVLLTAGSVGGGVWYFMAQSAKKTKEANEAEISSLQKQIDELGKKTATSGSTTTTKSTDDSFKFNELGIKLSLDSSVSDLYYSVLSKNSVGLSTKRLDSYGKYCLAGESPLGILKVEDVGPLDSTDPNYSPDRSVGALVKQLGTKYVYFMGPQASCSEVKAGEILQTTQLAALRQLLKNIALIQ